MTVTEISERKNILNHVLEPHDNLALVFPKSETLSDGDVRVWVFRIASSSLLKIPYYLVPEIDGNSALENAGGHPYYGRVSRDEWNAENDSDDYLFVPHSRPFQILDFSIGIYPRNLRMYSVRNGQPGQSLLMDTEIQIGDDHDYVDGILSPLENPSIYARQIAVQNLKIRYGFFNSGELLCRPALNILGKSYIGRPFTDPSKAKRVLLHENCKVMPVGVRGFSFKAPDSWPEALELSGEELLQMGA